MMFLFKSSYWLVFLHSYTGLIRRVRQQEVPPQRGGHPGPLPPPPGEANHEAEVWAGGEGGEVRGRHPDGREWESVSCQTREEEHLQPAGSVALSGVSRLPGRDGYYLVIWTGHNNSRYLSDPSFSPVISLPAHDVQYRLQYTPVTDRGTQTTEYRELSYRASSDFITVVRHGREAPSVSARQVKLWTPLGGIYHTQYIISILNWSQLISTDHNWSQQISTGNIIPLVAHKQYSNTLTERREPKFHSRTLGQRRERETKVNTSIRLGHHLGRGSESQVWGLEEPSAIYNHGGRRSLIL